MTRELLQSQMQDYLPREPVLRPPMSTAARGQARFERSIARKTIIMVVHVVEYRTTPHKRPLPRPLSILGRRELEVDLPSEFCVPKRWRAQQLGD